jgi:hypothetical protein
MEEQVMCMDEVDYKRYLKPQYLAIVAIAAVAGYFIVSRRKAAQAAETPTTEVISTERPVTDSSSTQAYDATTRALTDLQTKFNALTSDQGDSAVLLPTQPQSTPAQTNTQGFLTGDAAIAAQRIYEDRQRIGNEIARIQGTPIDTTPYPVARGNTQAEVDAMVADRARLGAILAQLQASQPTNPNVTNPALPSTRPVSTTPAPVQIPYPGLGYNYVMDCSKAPQNLLYTDWPSFKKAQTDKGLNSEQTARNLVSYALTGWGPSGGGATVGYIIGYDAVLKLQVQESMNQARVRGGLRPLSSDEFVKLSAEMRSLWPFDTLSDKQSQAIFHNYDGYAQQIWLHWNLPYQCPTAKRRF